MKKFTLIIAALLFQCQLSLALADRAGYQRTSALEQPYTQVAACMQVPVGSAPPASQSPGAANATWVGIQGGASLIIQAGLTLYVNTDGSNDFQAFYATGTGTIHRLGGTYPVLPFDWVCQDVHCLVSCTGSTTWYITITNCGRVLPIADTCASPLWTYSRTDVVTQATDTAAIYDENLCASSCGGAGPYVFNGNLRHGCIPWIQVQINNGAVTLTNGNGNQMLQATGTGTYVGATQSTSNLSASGDGYWTCWGRNNAFTTVPTADPFPNPVFNGGEPN